jgi:tetratricopeptide (TPR) repeat protein
MLPSMRRELGKKATAIDDAAVKYWFKEPGPAARAEEIYHRLWRGDAEEDLNPRWSPEAAFALEDAADEFLSVAPSDEAHAWLAERLSRELPSDVRNRIGQREWERDTELKARRLLADGKAEDALRLLNERPHSLRTPTSALWLVEADALLVVGQSDRALAVLFEAKALLDAANNRRLEARATRDVRYEVELLVRQVAIHERAGRLEESYLRAFRALELARTTGSVVQIFAVGVTVCRLMRKLGRDSDNQSLIHELVSLLGDPSVEEALKDHPSLLRESAAELGAHAPALLADALMRLGIETLSLDAEAWKQIPPEVRMLLHDQGVDPSGPVSGTRGARQTTAASLAKMLRGQPLPQAWLDAITKLFTSSVDRLM